jgi:hypothetical protein
VSGGSEEKKDADHDGNFHEGWHNCCGRLPDIYSMLFPFFRLQPLNDNSRMIDNWHPVARCGA